MTFRTSRFGRKTREAIRFVKGQVSAVVATGVDWIVVTVLIFEHAYYVHAVVVGAIAGGLTDFAIKKWWVFGTDLRRSPHEVWRYLFVGGLSALLNGALVYWLVDRLHIPKAPSVVLASILIGVCWNYPLHRLFVFIQPELPREET
jgi:putative flippase GtrA